MTSTSPHSPLRFGPLHGLFGALPPFPGKVRLIDLAAALSRFANSHEAACSPSAGTFFSIDLRDRIQRQMWCGSYEPHVTRCLLSILRPGDAFIDVGAHIGYHSFFAAYCVGETGRVFSFEPDPALFTRLRRNLSNFSHAQAINSAVWERDGSFAFERSYHSQESGWGTLTSVRDLAAGEHLTVSAVRLDSFCESSNVPPLRVMKIDAEGSEPAVLRGASAILSRDRPILLIEFNGVLLQQAGASSSQLANLIRAHHYSLFAISDRLVRPMDWPSDSELTDCIAIPDESLLQILLALRQNGYVTRVEAGS